LKIDYGCGPFKREGFVGVDLYPFPGVDYVLEDGRIPLEDDSVDYVYSKHVLEHVEDIWAVMAELYRVCEHGAVLELVLPHFTCCSYHWNLDHKRPFGLRSFDFAFGSEASPTLQFMTRGVKLKELSVSLEWWDGPTLQQKGAVKRTLLRLVGSVINGLANLHPLFCERVWSRWVGGFDNITYVLEVCKPVKED